MLFKYFQVEMLPLVLSPQAALAILGLSALYLIVRCSLRRSIAHLPGPDSDSWLLGNVPSFHRPEIAGEADFKWSEQYGLAFRTKGCFGEDLLYLADPKALQHIQNKSGYKYSKSFEARNRARLTAGCGIAWTEGAQHARHRKIMNPAFSSSALRGFLPVFFEMAHKSTNLWKTILDQQHKKSSIIDVSSWTSRITLDIIGAAALGYQFNAIEGGENELYNVFHNIVARAHYMPSNFTIVFRRALAFAPMWMSEYLFLLPKKDMRFLRSSRALVHELGKSLLVREKQMYDAGQVREGGSNVMSIFMKANLSEDPKRRLNDEEVISQIMTLALAGHDTSAATLTWVLFELSKYPDVQGKLRDEIRATREKANARGDQQFLMSDLESMAYMVSVIKETLRFHPIVMQIPKTAGQDDVIPLEYPQHTASGEKITAIPVSKGQNITISVCVYNRIKSIWGEDADQWKPERFLGPSPSNSDIKIGVFGNLATFGSGLRSCIGWRFAVLELQAIMIELIENFEFSPPPGNVEIRRRFAPIMLPMVKGQESKGRQMPLIVMPVAQSIPYHVT